MRYVFGFLCICALGVIPSVGCSESTGVLLCEGVTCEDDENECTGDGVCDPADGECDYAPVVDGTGCGDESNECAVGRCASGACELTPVTDGTACGDDAGTCQVGSCQVACTEQGIRDAIAAGGGPYTIDCNRPQTVVNEEPLVIDNDVELDGEGNLVIDANGSPSGAVEVYEGVTAVLANLTITNAGDDESCEFGCSAVSNDGALALIGVTVSEVSGTGVGNASDGTLTLRDVTVSDCEVGILNEGGQLTLTGGTVSRSFKDGILNFDAGTATLTNCTVSGNGLSEGGDFGIGNNGTMTLTNCTVQEHDVGTLGISNNGTLTVTNTLVDSDCVTEGGGISTSNGYNIESPGNTCGFDQGTDQPSVPDPMLGPLQDNGGPTETHALLSGSPAINQIPVEDCLDADGEPLATDQRGEPRLAGTTDPKRCDVGAFERQGAIKSGLWLGGSPLSNSDGSEFDTGWAICFYVNEEGTALIPSTECDIDGNDDEAYALELSWKNDVGGGTVQGEVGVCNANPEEGSESIGIGDSYPFEDAFGVGAVSVPIEDSSFAIPLGFLLPEVAITGGEIVGTFDGDTASGTANWDWSPGMGYSYCELDGGWTAAPAP